MEKITITANHGAGEFSREGIKLGRLFVHEVLVSDGEDGDFIEFRIAHAGTMYLMPGYYPDISAAMAAAVEIDKLMDWDAEAPNLVPKEGRYNHSEPVKKLGLKIIEIARKHGAEGLPILANRIAS